MTAASGADQPALRDQLAEALAGCFLAGAVTPWCLSLADALLPVVERAKAEAAAEALRGHSHTRWRNGDGPWQPDPCPVDCPAITPPP